MKKKIHRISAVYSKNGLKITNTEIISDEKKSIYTYKKEERNKIVRKDMIMKIDSNVKNIMTASPDTFLMFYVYCYSFQVKEAEKKLKQKIKNYIEAFEQNINMLNKNKNQLS